ncbi:MAG: 50S ribosomal protein L6 [Candidatus Terrybacteria bacterium]|nr:50S ribosomal protein L6 [Candidatus Terrybacteria bacterium]
MSRLGKKPIIIPENVKVTEENGVLIIKGPLGEISRNFKKDINIEIKEGSIVLVPQKNIKENFALWGTYASHIKNMIEGVTKGFEKKLIIEGVGFRAQLEESNLVLNLGLSHPVKVEIPKDLKVKTEKNVIVVFGADKEKVGQFSSQIRALKKPEPYKGKGIRYEGEIIRRKAGKKAAAAT